MALRAERHGADEQDAAGYTLDATAEAQRVVVIDGIPCFTEGLVRALGAAGFEAAEAQPGATDAGANLYVTSASTQGEWERVASLSAEAGVLVLVPTAANHDPLRALREGARGVMARSSPLTELVGAVRAVAQGLTVVPLEVTRQLVSLVPDPGASPVLSPAEQGWLEALAEGRTVTEIAEQSGYSRRAMHGKLDHLYSKMNVTNRQQALVKAARSGLL